MKHADFSIGKAFRCGDKRWRCTDVGARVIVAICLDHDDDPSWYNGPPYAAADVLVEFWRQAEPTVITVSPEAYDEFVKLLDAPPQPNERLRELMKGKPSWEKDGGKGDG